MPDSRLTSMLKQVRRRQLLVGNTAGLLWAIVAAVSALLICMWLDLLWELSPQLRVVAAVASALVGLLLLAWLGGQTWRAARDAFAARQIDRAGGFGGAIVSGWELSSQTASDSRETNAALTAGLADLAVGHATVLAATVHASEAISSRPARSAAGVFAGIAATVLVLLLCIPSLAHTQWRRFADPYGDVPPFSRLQFHVAPGDTQVIYGTGLDVHVTVSGGPADRVELVVEAGGAAEVLPMFPEASDKWRAALARITEPATYFVRADRARSQRYQIDVITVPHIESVRFRITPPAHTREAIYEGPLPKGGLAGLAGTKVNVWAKSNRPLSSGAIDVTADEASARAEMQGVVAGGHEVVGEFTIQASGKFELHVIDADGQLSQETFGGTITLLVDQRPFVRLLDPRAQSLATPEANLPIAVVAEDDYGIARVQLFRSLNDSRPLPMEFTIEEQPPRRMQGTTHLPLSTYGLSPGDEIKLFARVEDNDPAGAKGAESAVATVRIISQEDFERMLRAKQGLQVLMSKYQQAQRRMEKLAEQIEQLQEQLAKLPPDSPAAQEVRDALQKLAEELRQEGRAIEETAEHLLPYDLDKNLTDQLRELAKTMKQAAESAEGLAGEPGVSNKQLADELAELAKRLGSGGKKFQQAASEPLEHLALIYPLLEAESRFVILAMRQRDLAERMAALKGRDGEDDPALKVRMRELEEEQRKVREDLRELLSAIETHVERLPDDPQFDQLRETSLDFVAALRASGVADVMSQAEGALVAFEGTRAHEKADEAAALLESFLSQCEGMGDACKGCLAFNPGLSKGLGSTIEQLLAEAGLGMGAGNGVGMGEGAGGGYSARSSNASNIGLYGGLPALGPRGNGRGTAQLGPGPGSPGSLAGGNNPDQPTLVEADATGAASGAGQGTIPLRYRQRVGQYLQRLAEELNEP